MSVRRRLGDLAGADRATRAIDVLDEERLYEPLS